MDGLQLSSRRHFLYYLGQTHCLQAEVRLTEQLPHFITISNPLFLMQPMLGIIIVLLFATQHLSATKRRSVAFRLKYDCGRNSQQ